MDNITQKVEHGIVVVLVIVCAFLMHRFNSEKSAKEAAQIAAKGLPANVLAEYTYKNNLLTEELKNAQGKTVVVTKYVPDEGSITVITQERDAAIKKYQDLLASLPSVKSSSETKKIESDLDVLSKTLNSPPEIDATTWGLTSRFGYGLAVVPGHTLNYATDDGKSIKLPVSPEFDWKYFYWNRYSALIQVNAFYVGPEFTRHVDDVTPKWMHMSNTEAGVSGGVDYHGGKDIGVNMRTNW